MRIVGTASVMRHGATKYTKVFPDLAEEGLAGIRATAQEIARRFPKKPVFISSPADRAVGTALHVMEAYGLGSRKEGVQIETLLGPIHISDHALLYDHLKRVTGHIENRLELHRAWDRFYMECPDFENGTFCEARSSAKGRFQNFLRQLSTYCTPGCHVVAVTHIELVGSFVHQWFGTRGGYFGPAEVAHLELFDDGQLRVEFRGESLVVAP